MKWFQILTVTLCSLVLFAILVGCSGPKSIFPDKNLEAAIRDALDMPEGEEITVEELAELTELDAIYSGITNLSGIEYCTNLTLLSLSDNQIGDISPLSSLTSLKLLGLGFNKVQDISALSSLTNLIALKLPGNEISDISPLSTLVNLTLLYLRNNNISDIPPLASLTNLQLLWLSYCNISDISILVENSGLGEGDVVIIKKNNLDLTEDSDDMQNIKTLQDRGVDVIY